ncbi:MAG TPA: OsmC family peroxiredoxin [Gaiellaceae bacterium]|nr:OsmC family peroxiredoxin [Gaiellaceae bacterium]
MPRIERRAHVTWQGTVARGAGTITAASGAFEKLPYTLASRIGDPEGRTSPEELLAAAHAGCLVMSLGSELASRGTPPQSIDADCTVVMDEVDGQGHQIVASRVAVHVTADADESAIDAALERADQGCPFSALLRRAGADVAITLHASAQ